MPVIENEIFSPRILESHSISEDNNNNNDNSNNSNNNNNNDKNKNDDNNNNNNIEVITIGETQDKELHPVVNIEISPFDENYKIIPMSNSLYNNNNNNNNNNHINNFNNRNKFPNGIPRQLHLSSKHKNILPFQCGLCPQTFQVSQHFKPQNLSKYFKGLKVFKSTSNKDLENL